MHCGCLLPTPVVMRERSQLQSALEVVAVLGSTLCPGFPQTGDCLVPPCCDTPVSSMFKNVREVFWNSRASGLRLRLEHPQGRPEAGLRLFHVLDL